MADPNSVFLRNDTLQLGINQAIFQNLHSEDVPNKLGKIIVPVLVTNQNPLNNIVVDGSLSYDGGAHVATSATIYTTPSDRDFFLTGRALNYFANMTGTATYADFYCKLNVTLQDGTTSAILIISGLMVPLANVNQSINQPFYNPIRLARNSPITIDINVVGGVSVAYATAFITGYTADANIY